MTTEYPESETVETPEQESSEQGETSLLPKAMFKDAKVGDVIKVKVVASLEDELEVASAGEESPDKEAEEVSMEAEIAKIPTT